MGYALRAQHPLAMLAAADVAGTLVIFGFSVAFNNSSFYDPYWSVGPMVIVLFWALSPLSDGVDLIRQLVLVGLVWLWGARLTFNFLRGWRGLDQEDWRYTDFRETTGRAYWLVSLTGIHLVPTAFVFAGCLPLYVVFTLPGKPFGILDALAAAVTLAAILIEGLADNQLRRFVLSNPEKGRILDTGLWAYSRHPNYFGEILFWWGLFLFVAAVAPAQWWTAAGAVSITALFVGISVPLIDKRMRKSRPDYDEHVRRVSALVPWFRN